MKLLITAIAAAGFISAPAFAAEDLAQEKNCMSCHAADSQLVGPSYKDVAEKYADDDDAVEHLVKTIQEGSSDVWGSVPMPPNPQVSDDEAKQLAEWILGHE